MRRRSPQPCHPSSRSVSATATVVHQVANDGATPKVTTIPGSLGPCHTNAKISRDRFTSTTSLHRLSRRPGSLSATSRHQLADPDTLLQAPDAAHRSDSGHPPRLSVDVPVDLQP
ncbi:unnamed protein product [Phytophthora fragariaefolia]|uniref:Unnamed protein product n=1 Tax=Phytophthora fragariaefolia TaxID=1490495 RepID=A0A9W6UEY1_9STRA|nr:unnamed protein product [Phytophthora fragariaefolia]